MGMINYNHVKLPGRDSIVRVEVKLAGKKVGEILPLTATKDHKAGWAYFPKGHSGLRGEVFASLGLVKASLEAE